MTATSHQDAGSAITTGGGQRLRCPEATAKRETVGADGGDEADGLKWRVLSGSGVGLVELHRPHARNALTPALLRALARRLHLAATDAQVRVVVIAGAGKGFCAGADLKQGRDPQQIDHQEGGRVAGSEATGLRPGDKGRLTYERLMTDYRDAIRAITNCPKPVIAAINGAAAGAGASLALACDFRVMADDSYLLQAFVNVALVPDAGSSYFLVRQVGYSKALEISLEGKPIKADECLRLGLANKVVPASDLLPVTMAWAEQLGLKSAFCAGLTKSTLHFAATHSLNDTIEYEARMQQFCVESDDHNEGRTAFLNKRKPSFNAKPTTPLPAGTLARL